MSDSAPAPVLSVPPTMSVGASPTPPTAPTLSTSSVTGSSVTPNPMEITLPDVTSVSAPAAANSPSVSAGPVATITIDGVSSEPTPVTETALSMDTATANLNVPDISLTGEATSSLTAPPPSEASLAALSDQLSSQLASLDASAPVTASVVEPVAPPVTEPVLPTPLSEPTPSELPNTTNSPTPLSEAASLLGILQRDGNLTQEQVEQIELEHVREGTPIEKIVEEKQVVSEEILTKARAEFYSIPFVKLEEIGISPEALTQLPEGVARLYGILPFSLNKSEKRLSVAMKDPLDLVAIDFAEQKSGYNLVPHYAMPSELERLIAERYAQSLSSEVTQALKESDQVATTKKQLQDLSMLSGEVVRQAPITKIVETVLSFAMKARASDIHIEPQENRTRVRYRIDGILTEKLILPQSVHDAVVSRIKILSDLKIDEKRMPQDGRFTFFSSGEEVDLRISTLPTIHGEKIVMRLLKKNSSVPTLGDLGLRDLALRKVEDAIKVPHGIILVTGPTGSGKTTTLYSVLHKINTPKVNIMTLEDPVEYQMAGVNQVQINPQAGLTFASGLRSFLRQDPNIIMVGEIRDSETVELAVQASLTGHLVFSTLHTSSAAGAIPRLVDMGAEPFLLASSMTLTMAQRICRCLNPEYKEEYTPEQPVIDDIKAVLGDKYDVWCKQNNKDPNHIVLYRTKDSRPQTEPEYKGRIGIFEVMIITEEISKLIMEEKSAADLEKVAIKDGMLLMKQDGYLKALEGITTMEEVLRVAQV